MLTSLLGPFRRSLRWRTAALFLLGGIAPILLTGVAAWTRFETDLVTRLIWEHRQLLRQIANEIANELAWYRGQVQELGKMTTVQSMRAERMQSDLEAFLTFNPLFHRARVFSPAAKLIGHARRGAQVEDASAGDSLPPYLKAAFQGAMHSSVTTVTAPYRDRHGRVEIHIVAPVVSFVDEQPPVGALVATLRLHGPEIDNLVEPASFIGGSTYMCVTDPEGRVITRAGKSLPANLRTLIVEAASDAGVQDGVLTGAGIVAGRRDLLAAAPVPALGVRVIAGRPYRDVTDAMVGLLRSIVFYVALGVLLAVLLGSYLSRNLAGPILALVKGIQRVARGEVAHRIPVERTDELGQAAEAFNEMATQLEKGRLLEQLWQARWQPGKR